MAYDEDRKNYLINYAKENVKRIPLDVKLSEYEELKKAAEAQGMKLNSFIKKAITQQTGIELSVKKIKQPKDKKGGGSEVTK